MYIYTYICIHEYVQLHVYSGYFAATSQELTHFHRLQLYCNNNTRRFTMSTPTLQQTATLCNILVYCCDGTATHCNSGSNCHCINTGWTILRRAHCSTLQHTATYCNTLQHTATRCNTLHQRQQLPSHDTRWTILRRTHCNTLQHTAKHCITLQHTATHFNKLQRTATHCNTLHSGSNCHHHKT